MKHSIVVPLDGSLTAEQAVPWALRIAEHDRAGVHLLRVHTPIPNMIGNDLESDLELDACIRAGENQYLCELTACLCERSKSPVRYTLLEGEIAPTLQRYASALDSDLIVMTTHGRGAFSRFWLGSVSDQIIRTSTVPVLLIHPENCEGVDLYYRPPVPRIIICLDGSPLSETSLGPAVKLGRMVGAEYHLIRVLDPEDSPKNADMQANAYLEQIAQDMHNHKLVARTEVLYRTSPALAILEYAAARGDAPIAMTTHGRTGIQRAMLGSVADKVIRGAHGPVLIYQPVKTSSE
jgi:nucleotide-binding universal stress UspA family protein